jgi:hypothetical protein
MGKDAETPELDRAILTKLRRWFNINVETYYVYR